MMVEKNDLVIFGTSEHKNMVFGMPYVCLCGWMDGCSSCYRLNGLTEFILIQYL
jgi:hypothetical protein